MNKLIYKVLTIVEVSNLLVASSLFVSNLWVIFKLETIFDNMQPYLIKQSLNWNSK